MTEITDVKRHDKKAYQYTFTAVAGTITALLIFLIFLSATDTDTNFISFIGKQREIS